MKSAHGQTRAILEWFVVLELWMHLRDLMRIQDAYSQSNVASNKSEACNSFSFRQPRSRPSLTLWKQGNDVVVSNLPSETITLIINGMIVKLKNTQY